MFFTLLLEVILLHSLQHNTILENIPQIVSHKKMKFILSVMVSVCAFVFAAGKSTTACLECTSTCAILPPTGVTFPCYQGSPTDANKCYDTVKILIIFHCLITAYIDSICLKMNDKFIVFRILFFPAEWLTNAAPAPSSDTPFTCRMTQSTQIWSCGLLLLK